MKIPSLSRRDEPASTRDVNDDGRVDGRDRAPTAEAAGRNAEPAVTDRDRTTYRSNAATGHGRSHAEENGPRGADRTTEKAPRTATAHGGTPADAPTRPNTVVGPDSTLERPLDRGSTIDLAEDRNRVLGTTTVDGRDRVAGAAVVDRERVDADGDPRPVPDEPAPTGPKPRTSLLATFGLITGVAGALFVLTGTLAGYGIALGALGAVLAVFGLIATRRRHVAGTTDALLGILFGLGAVVLGVVAMTGLFDWPTTDGEWVGRFREWLDSQFVDRF